MKDTMFTAAGIAAAADRADRELHAARLAVRGSGDAQMLRGVVHDPTARRMGGVAGHAGLFSTAADLASSAGCCSTAAPIDGARILSPLTVAKMTTPATPAARPNVRGLGLGHRLAFSSNRGELLPIGSFGHTGFTGTSLWIDPATRMFVVFLSNRVHPDGKGDVTPLRARVATVAAVGARRSLPPPQRGRRPGPAATSAPSARPRRRAASRRS